MTAIEHFLNQSWTARLGWMLVHFFWQGTLIAALFAAVRSLAGRRLAPEARYALACLAMASLAAVPALTFLAAGEPGPGAGFEAAGRAAAAWWQRILPLLVPVWIAGVVAFSVRLLAGWRWTRRLRSVAVIPVAAEWQRALNELTHRMRVGAPVRLLASSLATSPAVVGWLRPVILMPVEALAGLPIEKVRALLAHELAHIRRHDYPVNILQSVVETVLFYHPAVWWISAQVRAEREACCDDMAVAATGDLLVYASALADLDSRRRARLQAVLAASGGSLVNRIRRLVGESQPESHNLPGPGVAWALSLLWLAGIGAAALHSAPTPPERSTGVAHRRFAAPQAVTPAPVLPDQAPRTTAAPLSPLVSALLYDPLFSLAPDPAPPAAAAAQAQAPQATLEGLVVSAVDQTPIAGARVQMVQPYGEGEPLYARTDAQGHFRFPRAAAGAYALAAERPGFLRTQEPRNAHDLLYLVDLMMPDSGPADVRTSGTTAIRSMPWVRPLGTSEIPGIGSFTKSVDPDGSLHGSVVIPLTPYAVIAGKVTEPGGIARDNCPVQIVAKPGETTVSVTIVRTDDRGEYRAARLAPGTYYVLADKSGPWTSTMRTYRSTYYPRALDAASATPIVLAAGQQVRADIRILSSPGVDIAGAVATAPGTGDSSTKVLLYQPEVIGNPAGGFAEASGGRFLLRNVTPGRYTLAALTRAKPAGGAEGKPLLGALRQIEVGDQNQDGVDLDLQPLPDIPGTVTMLPGCTAAPVRVIAAGGNSLGSSQADTAVPAGGEFTLSGLTPAKHRLAVMVPPGYFAATARLGGRDVLKDGFYYPSPQGAALAIAVGCTGNGRAQ